MTKRTPRPTRYRSRPSEIEAVQWKGDRNSYEALSAFVGELVDLDGEDELSLLAGKDGAQDWVPVPVGHWVVRNPGDNSDVWPVDPEYFKAKYEPVTIGMVIHNDNPISGPTTRPGGPPPAAAAAIALRQAEQRRMRS